MSLSYDPLLRLYQSSTAARRFAYDGGNIIAEYNSSDALQARHVFGPARTRRWCPTMQAAIAAG